ncbi:hypothetical protein [Sporosarcina beigongshangi]|uniref:hypothetical protein n=1 Tax=Sporosarcina beigongshangi TaxID=2782538 RepID=UPI00193A9A43|nr:hypothetical protein [Sporosarcina beigongshangi]
MKDNERQTFIIRLKELYSYFEEDLKASDIAKVQEEIDRIEKYYEVTLDDN